MTKGIPQKHNPFCYTAKQIGGILFVLLCFILLFGCSKQETINEKSEDSIEFYASIPTPTPTPTPTPSAVPTPTPSPIVTPVPSIYKIHTPTATQSPEPTSVIQPAFKVDPVDNIDGYVLGHDVNLRSGPGKEYDVSAVISYHTHLTIVGESDQWYQISVEGLQGFMFKDFVGIGAVPTPEPTATPIATPKPTPTPTPTPEPKPTPTPESIPDVLQISEAPAESTGDYSEKELYLAAKLIYAEGKHQTEESFLAMANVLYYRCQSSKFGGGITSISTEVYRSGQFTVVNKSSFKELVPSESALQAVKSVFQNGVRVLPEGVMFFRTERLGTTWSSSRRYYATIGGNCYFY